MRTSPAHCTRRAQRRRRAQRAPVLRVCIILLLLRPGHPSAALVVLTLPSPANTAPRAPPASARPPHQVNHLAIPAACFTHPEIAFVGMDEVTARKEAADGGFELGIGMGNFRANSKALAEAEGEGVAKVMFNQKTRKVRGGPAASAPGVVLRGSVEAATLTPYNPNRPNPNPNQKQKQKQQQRIPRRCSACTLWACTRLTSSRSAPTPSSSAPPSTSSR